MSGQVQTNLVATRATVAAALCHSQHRLQLVFVSGFHACQQNRFTFWQPRCR